MMALDSNVVENYYTIDPILIQINLLIKKKCFGFHQPVSVVICNASHLIEACEACAKFKYHQYPMALGKF